MLIIALGLTFIIRNVTSPQITIVWQTTTPSFTQQDQQNIQTALQSIFSTQHPGSVTGHIFTIIDGQRRGDWAIFSANERVNASSAPIPTEPLFLIAHQQGTTWTIWLPGSSGFCDQLKQVPDTLLDATDKGYFC